MSDFVGPCKIDCADGCDVPAGVTLSEVPTPRHTWTDVMQCPHDGCGRCFLIVPEETP